MVRLVFGFCLLSCAVAAPLRPGTPAGVTVEICEQDIPKGGIWPAQAKATETYTEDVFGFFELPQKYISTGVRADRSFPTLVRASATVSLPPGRHRVLLRSRGETRQRRPP